MNDRLQQIKNRFNDALTDHPKAVLIGISVAAFLLGAWLL